MTLLLELHPPIRNKNDCHIELSRSQGDTVASVVRVVQPLNSAFVASFIQVIEYLYRVSLAFNINLVAFYHEYRSLIGYATHHLFKFLRRNKYADFKNIKFPRGNYQTDSLVT